MKRSDDWIEASERHRGPEVERASSHGGEAPGDAVRGWRSWSGWEGNEVKAPN
ncbi:hypothetical protein CRG98_007143 [Punica granatum]|uniref:Uncharacterized protein n=1 Tax=Punica granatum TaxID=22663 RepID=A0A2I0KXC2_PUNGR|nr:hypothetical protein CRG98_007143 [Punica granatum]